MQGAGVPEGLWCYPQVGPGREGEAARALGCPGPKVGGGSCCRLNQGDRAQPGPLWEGPGLQEAEVKEVPRENS